MSAEVKKEIPLEIAHVLCTDIVGFSKLLINEQRRVLDTLNQIVRGTEEFRSAEAAGRLLKIPTGDGMALVFYNSSEAPVECALEISRALKEHPELRLRMGVHSGPISGVVDLNERANVTGAGINVAQRVMDCGDAGHILLSKHVAEDLEQYGHWQPHLHDLGEIEVKHGARFHMVNLCTEELGNPALPEKFRQIKGDTNSTDDCRTKRSGLVIACGSITLLICFAVVALHFRDPIISSLITCFGAPPPSTSPAAPPVPEKSIAVLPFENRSEEKTNAYFADGFRMRF